jgi:hypothetical protein
LYVLVARIGEIPAGQLTGTFEQVSDQCSGGHPGQVIEVPSEPLGEWGEKQ